ncbi:anti-anti-sigma factor [Synechococcus sp. PCC 7502]|uniref:STAS domain-containing protein n=1 Tax=Synechococcus sp. PCC 7502 TaxID=1173263 RepID=UPI00029F8980|nr:STAS domain-containing protein [Synechococcus sp. PCC 7502]AFY74704.1 anti-anti-sigma factor [Synechococcus sp. PCC 7502]
MALQIHTASADPQTVCLTLNGELDTITSPDLDKAVQSHLACPEVKILILDLQKLSYVSSAGLRIFAKTRKAVKSRGGKLFFTNLSPQVKKVFDIVKAVPLSEVFVNTQELDAYLAVMQSQAEDEEV